MADVQKLTDAELGDAVDRVSLTAIDESHPVIKEWIDRRRAGRVKRQMATSETEDRGAVIELREARLKRVNQVTREEALRISQQVLKDAERGRIEAAEREAKQGPTYCDDWPTAPAGVRGLLKVLQAWGQRVERMGDERSRHELSWPNVMDGRLAEIKDASPENKYARVADMAAACLAWLQLMALDEEATDGIDS